MRSEHAARYQRRSRRVAPADTYPPYMSLGGIGYKGMNLFFKNFENFHGPIFTPTGRHLSPMHESWWPGTPLRLRVSEKGSAIHLAGGGSLKNSRLGGI